MSIPRSASGKRYRRCILATCCVPWDERLHLAEEIFRRQVRRLIQQGIRDLYIFGTAGEGYAVNDRQFEQVTRVFLDETRAPDVQSMVGLISLSLPTVIERIERARAWGARRFQLSLPSWGALRDTEVATFFRETCGRFPDCEFLHYNLLRTHRLITPAEYGQLARRHPNLVATKNSTNDLARLRGLLTEAPELQHFITEGGFGEAAMMGECGFLVSIANTNLEIAKAYFAAGLRQDRDVLTRICGEAGEIVGQLKQLADPDTHMDAAFDKMYCRVNDGEFPLRLLPPYAGASEEFFRRWTAFIREKFPGWLPPADNQPGLS